MQKGPELPITNEKWVSLRTMLNSPNMDDITFAIGLLDEMYSNYTADAIIKLVLKAMRFHTKNNNYSNERYLYNELSRYRSRKSERVS